MVEIRLHQRGSDCGAAFMQKDLIALDPAEEGESPFGHESSEIGQAALPTFPALDLRESDPVRDQSVGSRERFRLMAFDIHLENGVARAFRADNGVQAIRAHCRFTARRDDVRFGEDAVARPEGRARIEPQFAFRVGRGDVVRPAEPGFAEIQREIGGQLSVGFRVRLHRDDFPAGAGRPEIDGINAEIRADIEKSPDARHQLEGPLHQAELERFG